MASFASRIGSRLLSRGKALAPWVINKGTAGFACGAVTFMPILTGEDFFEHKFITKKDADDVVDFYSTEDFLQILGIFPMAIHFVLAGVEWDTSKENTMNVYNAMEISFVIEEREEDLDNGEKAVVWFQKKERFKNFIPFTPFLMWDQTQCYGYNRKEDGSLEIFHKGDTFYGPLPVRFFVQLHALYVIWATEKHINSPLFGESKKLEEQEHQRGNVLLYVVGNFLKRLSLAYRVGTESAALVLDSDTQRAEQVVDKIGQLRRTRTEAYAQALRRANVKRTLTLNTNVSLEAPEAEMAMKSQLISASQNEQDKAAASAALDGLLANPQATKDRIEVVVEKPRYRGAFNARGLGGIVKKDMEKSEAVS